MSHDTHHDMSVKQRDTNIPLNVQQFLKLFTFKWLRSLADISMLHQTIKSLFLKIFNVLRAKAQRSSTVCVLLKMTRFNELYCRKFEPMRSLEHKTRTNEITPFGTLMPIFGNVPHKGTYHSILLGNLVLLLNY